MDFQRTEMLLGAENIQKLQQARVAVIGLGGVGSYIAEALCRSGVGSLLLIDADTVAPSNINRQLPALNTTVGRLKTQVMRERLLSINPECRIDIISKFYNPGDFDSFFAGGGSMTSASKNFTDQNTDTETSSQAVAAGSAEGSGLPLAFIADAIDSTASKVDLLIAAHERQIPIISAMGTGNKLDPSQLRVADIGKTEMCPLAKSIRKRLRDRGITKGITVVFSMEQPQYAQKGATPGSMVFVPASAGLLMASYIVRRLIGQVN